MRVTRICTEQRTLPALSELYLDRNPVFITVKLSSIRGSEVRVRLAAFERAAVESRRVAVACDTVGIALVIVTRFIDHVVVIDRGCR